MEPKNFVIPTSTGSTVGLMTRILPDGTGESGYLVVAEDDSVRWVAADTPSEDKGGGSDG